MCIPADLAIVLTLVDNGLQITSNAIAVPTHGRRRRRVILAQNDVGGTRFHRRVVASRAMRLGTARVTAGIFAEAGDLAPVAHRVFNVFGVGTAVGGLASDDRGTAVGANAHHE